MNALQAWRCHWDGASLRLRVLLLLGLSSVFLIAMAASEQIRRSTGAEIVLRTRPVDPRDLLRGAYVALAYEAERVHLPDLPTQSDPSAWRAGDTLFLAMHKENDAWKPVALSAERPALAAGDVLLRAIYVRREDYADVTAPGQNMPVDILLDFGIDHYYADEKTAKQLEADAREQPLDVILSVGGDGKPVIKGLMINGQAHYETLL
jgi:uncharacterized membrane-anchored protein